MDAHPLLPAFGKDAAGDFVMLLRPQLQDAIQDIQDDRALTDSARAEKIAQAHAAYAAPCWRPDSADPFWQPDESDSD